MSTDNTDSNVRDTIPDLQPYCDAELDEAMREFMTIEAAERDLVVIQQIHRRKFPGRGFSSRLAAWLTASLVMLSAGVASADDAPTKPKRPVMCMSGAPVSGNGLVYFVCTDGKRPRILLPYVEVQFAAEDGSAASYVLGWPAKQTKPIPLPRKLPKDEKAAKRITTVKL